MDYDLQQPGSSPHPNVVGTRIIIMVRVLLLVQRTFRLTKGLETGIVFDMTRYQEKLQEVRDKKQAEKAREELERQAEEEKNLAEGRAADKAEKVRRLKARSDLIRVDEEKERIRLEHLELERGQIKTFQDFVETKCLNKLDHIQTTGEIEICEISECGIFHLKFEAGEDDYTLDLHWCAKVWDSKLNNEKTIRVDQDPRINYIRIEVEDYENYERVVGKAFESYRVMRIYVQHGDPEEWESNVPRALEGTHDGGYRSASESADIEYRRSSADIEHHKGYAAPTLGWWDGINESVENFFLDLGFFGGRK